MRKSHIVHFLFFFSISLFSEAQPTDKSTLSSKDQLEIQIDRIVENAITQKAFPGCVIYASKGDNILFFKSYGYHTYESLQPVNKGDIYDLASISKVIGATLALMKLYDDGLIHLDDPIQDYVDGIGRKIGRVTLREALAHQGGLYPWIPYYMKMRKKNGSYKKKSVSSIQDENYTFALSDSLFLHRSFYDKIKKMIKKSIVAESPTYHYSGLFFYLVPEIVQSLTGIPYENYLDQHFYEPLKTTTLGFNPTDQFDLTQIVPTEIDTFFRMKTIHGWVHDEGAIMMKGVSGNAGLFSNVEDMAKIWKMLLQKGRYDTIQFLSKQTITLFTTTQYPNLNNRRGLGFDKPLQQYHLTKSSVAKDASFQSYGHTGYTGTLAWVDPVNELTFIFLANRTYPSRSYRTIYQLNVRPNIHQAIYDFLKIRGNQRDEIIENTK